MTWENARCLLLSLLMICLSASFALADPGDIALGVKAGTLGLGAEATVGLLPALNLRAGANTFSVDFETNTSDIDYDLEVDMLSFPVVIDLHPFKDSGFRISAGVLFNKNKANAEGSSQSSYTIGGTEYTAAELGTLTGKIDYNDLAPYVGIGWGNAVGKNKQWSFSFDFGVVFQGKPNIDLAANGPLASDPTFQANLTKEKQALEDELDDYKYYPVISLGITYKF